MLFINIITKKTFHNFLEVLLKVESLFKPFVNFGSKLNVLYLGAYILILLSLHGDIPI